MLSISRRLSSEGKVWKHCFLVIRLDLWNELLVKIPQCVSKTAGAFLKGNPPFFLEKKNPHNFILGSPTHQIISDYVRSKLQPDFFISFENKLLDSYLYIVYIVYNMYIPNFSLIYSLCT